jgi:hypothetical protein
MAGVTQVGIAIESARPLLMRFHSRVAATEVFTALTAQAHTVALLRTLEPPYAASSNDNAPAS